MRKPRSISRKKKNQGRKREKITLGEKKVRSAAKLPNIYACPK